MNKKLFNVYDPRSYLMFNNTGNPVSTPTIVNNTPQIPYNYNTNGYNNIRPSELALTPSELRVNVGSEIATNNAFANSEIGRSASSVPSLTNDITPIPKGTSAVGRLSADYANGLIDKNTYETQLAKLNGEWTTKDWTNLGLSGANAALNAYGMFQQLNLARDQYGLQRDNFNLLKQKYDDDKQARADTVAAIRSSF